MKLIQRLETTPERTKELGLQCPYGIFECPECKEQVHRNIAHGNSAKTCGDTKCVESMRINKIDYSAAIMRVVEKLGVIEVNGKRENSSIFECPYCEKHVTLPVHTGIKQKSCGAKECVAKSTVRKRTYETITKHGKSGTRIYKVWRGMLARCNPKFSDNPAYKNYSGKGIKVCEEWHDFDKFYSDMGEEFEYLRKEYEESNWDEGMKPSIDRKESDKDYCKANCRWLTMSENSRRATAKTIVQLTKDNKLIATFESAAEAERNGKGFDGKNICASKVNLVCLGRRKSNAGCLWKFIKDCTNEELNTYADIDWDIPTVVTTSKPAKEYRQINQLNKETREVVSTFNSYVEAGEFLDIYRKGFSKIKEVCERKRNTAYGFAWEYADSKPEQVDDNKLYELWDKTIKLDCSSKWKFFDTFKSEIPTLGFDETIYKVNTNKPYSKSNVKVAKIGEEQKTKQHRGVVQIDKSTNAIVATFASPTEAEHKGIASASNIRNVCSGKRKSAGGFYWKWIED